MSTDALWGLIGVIVGWLLSTISSKMGKVKMEICSSTIKFFRKGKEFMEQEEILYSENPDFIDISIDMSVYNDYSERRSVDVIGYKIMANGREFDFKPVLQGIDVFSNMDPHTFIKSHIYYMHNGILPKEVAADISSGYKIYLLYRINNGKMLHKQLIKKV